MSQKPDQTTGARLQLGERFRRDLPGEDVEAALGPPNAVIRTTGGRGDHAMWAYQREGLYLYFNGGRLVAWRTYPHGCNVIPSLGRRSRAVESAAEAGAVPPLTGEAPSSETVETPSAAVTVSTVARAPHAG